MVSVSALAGLVLHYFGKDRLAGFVWIFAFAGVCRFFAWGCLTQMVEPFRKSSHDVYFSFIDFIRQIRHSPFARFVVFVSSMIFAVNLSSPLLSLFLLKDLGLSYAEYMVMVTTANLAGFMFQEVWGRLGDRYGNVRMIKISAWGIALIPLLWMASRDLRFLFFVQFVAGFFWGGFNLLQINVVMEAASPQKRIRCLSYFNVMNAGALFLGALLGGALIHHLPLTFGYSFLTLFLISFFFRTFSAGFVASTVRDIRHA